MKVLVIIPAYNEEDSIERVIENLQSKNSTVDYVIVNDCSQDNTRAICEKNNYNFVNLPVNLGIGGGVQTGYLYAREHGYDIAIQMDGDGQHRPEFIETVIAPIIDGQADVVIGSRFLTREGFQSTGLRRFGIKFLSITIRLCSGIKVNDVTSGFRAVNRKFIEIYAEDYAQDYPEPEAIMAAALHGARVMEVPVLMEKRIGGLSSIRSFKSVYYMIKVSLAIVLQRIVFRRKEQ